MIIDDPLWNEFVPLWSDLPNTQQQVFVAGGYALFLKQRWLFEHRETPTIVPVENWIDPNPRVTKDIDLVIGLELLSSTESQGAIVNALGQNGFHVVQDNPRWQFEKPVSGNRHIIVDLHSEIPSEINQKLTMDKLRVKHKPSLGDEGVHGRQNPQAAGCTLYPFQFSLDAVSIVIPNPVTLAVMKSAAAQDRWRKSQETGREQRSREFHFEQAMKHARDLTRVIAMTTRNERDNTKDVIGAIRDAECFAQAMEAFKELFGPENGWGSRAVQSMWRTEDFHAVRETLAGWFGLS